MKSSGLFRSFSFFTHIGCEMILSDRILNLSESATIKMAQKARELKAEGIDVISLSLGEPDFDTPNHIKEKAIEALKDGKTKYTPVPGIPELRDAIVEKFKRDNDLEYSRDQIVVSCGAKQSIANVMLCIINPGLLTRFDIKVQIP